MLPDAESRGDARDTEKLGETAFATGTGFEYSVDLGASRSRGRRRSHVSAAAPRLEAALAALSELSARFCEPALRRRRQRSAGVHAAAAAGAGGMTGERRNTALKLFVGQKSDVNPKTLSQNKKRVRFASDNVSWPTSLRANRAIFAGEIKTWAEAGKELTSKGRRPGEKAQPRRPPKMRGIPSRRLCC